MAKLSRNLTSLNFLQQQYFSLVYLCYHACFLKHFTLWFYLFLPSNTTWILLISQVVQLGFRSWPCISSWLLQRIKWCYQDSIQVRQQYTSIAQIIINDRATLDALAELSTDPKLSAQQGNEEINYGDGEGFCDRMHSDHARLAAPATRLLSHLEIQIIGFVVLGWNSDHVDAALFHDRVFKLDLVRQWPLKLSIRRRIFRMH